MRAGPRSGPPFRPLWLVLAAFAAATVGIAWRAAIRTDGHFVYAQDDPYIHLTLARTLASSGVWGLEAGEPAAASSGPFWTMLLALLSRLGATAVWWPFVINLAAGATLLVIVHRQLQNRMGAPMRTIALLAFTFVLPLPTLIFIGMEHTLHVLCVVALCGAAASRLADEDSRDGIWPAGALLAALTAGLRYEGLFVIAVIALLAWLRGRRVLAVSLVLAGALPVAAYAAYASAHGSWMLPNSVVVKSGAARFASSTALPGLVSSWVNVFWIYRRPPQLALVLAAAVLAAWVAERGRSVWNAPHLLVAMFIGIETLHVCLVNVEWFYRYEAYVVAIGMLAIFQALADLHASGRLAALRAHAIPVRRAAVTIAIVVLCLPLFLRGASALMRTPVACGEVYRQQYQLGRFFRDFYRGDAIAINDIGAVSWMARVTIVDLVGLASNEIANARRAGEVNAAFIAAITARRGVAAVAIYESHFRTAGELPPHWIKVGDWTMPSAFAVNGDTVAFFAPTPEHVPRLRSALEEFARRLPSGVRYVPAYKDPATDLTTSASPTAKSRSTASKDRSSVEGPPNRARRTPAATRNGM
jgi:hypothetical protein